MMQDLISRQAAIDALKGHRALFCDNTPDTFSKLSYGEKCRVDELDTAISTLVNLPSAQSTQTDTSNTLKALDCVERQAAIDALDNIKIPRNASWYPYYQQALTVMSRLPSAQSEIVRCRECKYCEHWYADKGRCFLWHEDGISVFEDGFCNYAERRTDDDGRDQSADTSQSAG